MLATILLSVALAAATDTSELDAAMALLDRLDAASTSVEYREQKLGAVIEDLSQRLQVPVRSDWDSLVRLGIRPDDPVTFRVGVSKGAAILAGLALTMGDEYERPVFEAHAGQMVLTTQNVSAAMRVTGVYDVRDLLADAALLAKLSPPASDHADDSSAEPSDDRKPATSHEPPAIAPREPADPPPVGGRRHHPAPNPPESPEITAEPPAPPTAGQRLFQIISDHVDPDAWMNFGGDRALVSEIDGVLIVTAPPTTHRRFREALSTLRAANAPGLSVDVRIIDVERPMIDRLKRQSPPNSSSYLAGLSDPAVGRVVWTASGEVAIGAGLDVETKADAILVRVKLQPSRNADAGTLTIEIEAHTRLGSDERSVRTTIALSPDQPGAAVELPGGDPKAPARMLVLRVKR